MRACSRRTSRDSRIPESLSLRTTLVTYLLLCGEGAGALGTLNLLLGWQEARNSIRSKQLGQICSLLAVNHVDMLRRVLDLVRREIMMERKEYHRMMGLAKLVGFVALYSRDDA
jgi:hypothetical protein